MKSTTTSFDFGKSAWDNIKQSSTWKNNDSNFLKTHEVDESLSSDRNVGEIGRQNERLEIAKILKNYKNCQKMGFIPPN